VLERGGEALKLQVDPVERKDVFRPRLLLATRQYPLETSMLSSAKWYASPLRAISSSAACTSGVATFSPGR